MGFLQKLRFWKKRPSNRIFPDACEAEVTEVKQVFGKPQVAERGSTPGSSPSESTCCGSAEHEDITSTQTSDLTEEVMATITPEGPELIDFEMPLHEIAYVLAAEFGPEVAHGLQSSKWDQRQRALQMMSCELKGTNLQWLPPGAWKCDRQEAWRVSCQVLGHVLKDKVIPVQLAALQLFRDAFENIDAHVTAEEVQHALDVLLDPVMQRLGDSNVRLHEAAQSNLVFARYLLGDKLLYRLRHFLETSQGSERNKAHFGVLDTVNALLRAPCPWRLEDLSIFVILGLDETLGNPRVRNRAVALAATLYRLHGPPVAEALMEELRPAKQTLLREKFREIDEELNPSTEEDTDEGDLRPDLDDLLHCLKAACLPGQIGMGGDEETLMDGILEETGHVFIQSSGIVSSSGRPRLRKSVSFSPTTDIVEVELEEELILEHEALCLGVDFEEDQEALLREILMDSDEESHQVVG